MKPISRQTLYLVDMVGPLVDIIDTDLREALGRIVFAFTIPITTVIQGMLK